MVKRDAMARKNMDGIDCFELIAAILIVFLHAVETSEVCGAGLQYVFTRFCVPFFFICSGYFFARGSAAASDSKEYFFRYEKRLLGLFLFYGVLLSAPVVISGYLKNYSDASPLKLFLLIIRRLLVAGHGAYWYLIALIISTAFLYFVGARSEKLLVSAIAAGLILQIGYTSFGGIIAEIPAWSKLNDLFYLVFS